jgi:hypothetical protein
MIDGMARVTATYDDGATVTYDDDAVETVTGDADVIAALRAQIGWAEAFPEGPPVNLAIFNVEPFAFIAAVTALRAPSMPELTSDGLEPIPEAPTPGVGGLSAE